MGNLPLSNSPTLASILGGKADATGTMFANPALPGGLLFPNDGISLANRIDRYNLTDTRTKAQIGHLIQLTDGQSGPASGVGINTAPSASYGLAITGYRPAWATSSITGEMDAVSIVLRQACGDCAGILSNIGIQSGYAATLESVTMAADSAGNPLNSVRTQLGVANPRDNEYYGLVLQAEAGASLTCGLLVSSSSTTANWAKYIEVNDSVGQPIFRVAGDGSTLTKNVAPFTQFAGNLGGPGLEYNVAYLRMARVTALSYGSLATLFPPSTNDGMIARINDAAVAPVLGNAVTAGAGTYKCTVMSNGAQYIVIMAS